jgi:hypothetical protein
MQTGWLEEGDTRYYLKPSGAMATDWQQINDIWYYFGSNGKMKTGWQKVDGIYYFLKSSGVMASDEYIDGYYLDRNGAWTYQYRITWRQNDIGWWYGDNNGWYAKDETIRIDGIDYDFDSEGYCTNP